MEFRPPAITSPTYLAVTEDGEIIGYAQQRGSCVWLRFEAEVHALPASFRLVPIDLSEDLRQAPALSSRTPQGFPAIARLKVGGYYRVTCYASNAQETPFILLDALYDEWLWKRTQRLAQGPINRYPASNGSSKGIVGQRAQDHGLEGSGPGMAPLFLLPFQPRR